MLIPEERQKLDATAHFHLHIAEKRVRELCLGHSAPSRLQDLAVHVRVLCELQLNSDQGRRLQRVEAYYRDYVRSLLSGGPLLPCDVSIGNGSQEAQHWTEEVLIG